MGLNGVPTDAESSEPLKISGGDLSWQLGIMGWYGAEDEFRR
jgi:hypothetical protein